MTVVVPNVPTPVPSRADPLNFAARADAYHTALPITVDALNLQNAENNSINAAVNLVKTQVDATATSVALTAGVTPWSSLTSYVVGNCVFDPVDFLTYRRKTSGVSATRPGLDAANWMLLTGFGDVTLTGTQTLTNKTLALGSNTISGTLSQFNSALTDADFASLAGAETLTNKTFGDNPTLSAGTANGVLYLNGGKVASSGSALTFDGASLRLANAVGTTANGLRLDGGAQAHYWYLADNTSSVFDIGSSVGNWRWGISGAEQMRLTSTGLGIGTSNPQAKLHVLDALKVSSADQSAGSLILGDGGSSQFAVGIGRWNGSTNAPGAGGLGYFAQGSSNSGGHFWYCGDGLAGATSERMRLDPNGSLGLGVTPSPWGTSVFKALQVGTGAAFAGNTISGTPDAYMISNAYYDGTTWRYIHSDAAMTFDLRTNSETSIVAAWNIAQPGTAGNPITFTQAMTLDSSGNLLVGTTSRGHIGGATSFDLDAIDGNIYINHATGTPSGYYYCSFGYGTAPIGSISQNGTTGVLFNTSSDYRLKNITGPVTNSGTYVDSLKPVEGTWKADGSTFVGLIAHEVQEVSRTSVATGVKDGELMQALDYSNSELIANLIAEIQSLRARVAALESA